MIADMADKVTASLNAEDFSLDFTAVRRYVPIFELSDLDSLQVSVIPRGREDTPLTRGTDQREVEIQVGVQKRVASLAASDVDPLVALTEEIADHLTRQHLGDSDEYRWLRTEFTAVYSPEDLREKRVYTGVVTATYRHFN